MTTERSASAQPDREAGSTSTPGVATRVQGPADFQRTPHGSEGSASPLHPTPRTKAQIIMEWVRALPNAHGEHFFATRDCIQASLEVMERELAEERQEHQATLALARQERDAFSDGMPKWIPITERAPDDGVHVLVFDHDDLFPWVGECLHCLMGGEHFFYGGGEGDSHYHVTHWMPLPEAPK